MYNIKETARKALIYSAISPMFFSLFIALVHFGLELNKTYDTYVLYFYIWVESAVMALLFLFFTLLFITRESDEKKGRLIFYGFLIFTFSTLIFFTVIVTAINLSYGLDLLKYALHPKL